MTDREFRERLQKSVNNTLSCLEPSARQCDRIVQETLEGKKVMKKHISLALVLAILLACVSVGAAAASDIQYFNSFAALEKTYGVYNDWPDAAKVSLVNAMMESGASLDEEKVAQMNAQHDSGKAGELAEEILTAYFGTEHPMNIFNLMQRELGLIENWSLSDKALYTALRAESGEYRPEDETLYLLPSEGDMQEKDAIDAARAYLYEVFALDNTLDSARAYTQFLCIPVESSEPYWLIEFSINGQYTDLYRVHMTRTGELVSCGTPTSNLYTPNIEKVEVESSDIFAGIPLPGAVSAEIHDYDIDAEAAIKQCKLSLGELGNLPCTVSEMNFQAAFLYHKDFNLGKEPVWFVTSWYEGKMVWKTLLAYNGDLIDTTSAEKAFDRVRHSYIDSGLRLYDLDGKDFNFMTLEEKAAFSQTWNPIIDAYILENPYYPNYNTGFYQATRNVFGVPNEQHLQQEAALKIAQSAILDLGADPDTLEKREVRYSFVVTDAENPYWVLYFFPPMPIDMANIDTSTFQVKVHAFDGNVIEAFNSTGVVTGELY